MSEVNFIALGYTGDISQFFLAFSGDSPAQLRAPSSAEQANAQSIITVVIIGNPSFGFPFGWLDFGFLPSISVPVFDIYDAYGYSKQTTSISRTCRMQKNALARQRPVIQQIWNGQSNDNDFSVSGVDPFGKRFDGEIAVGVLKEIFTNFKFNVVTNMVLKPGYGGFTNGSGTSFFSDVSQDTLVAYDKSYGSIPGMNFYMLHEMAHNLPFVKQYEIDLTTAYKQVHGNFDNYGANDIEFQRIEAVTNTVARALAQSLGVPIPTNVTHGFY